MLEHDELSIPEGNMEHEKIVHVACDVLPSPSIRSLQASWKTILSTQGHRKSLLGDKSTSRNNVLE